MSANLSCRRAVQARVVAQSDFQADPGRTCLLKLEELQLEEDSSLLPPGRLHGHSFSDASSLQQYQDMNELLNLIYIL